MESRDGEPVLMLGVIAQIDAYDPVAGAAVTLRAASHDDEGLCLLGQQIWWPALTKLPAFQYDLFDGAFGNDIEAPSTSFSLSAEPWALLGRYQLADAAVRIWAGEVGQRFDLDPPRFSGRVTAQPKLADGLAEITIAADDAWLDTPVLALYAGTGGIEGGADLTGQPKPLALGAPRYVAGTLIDTVNSVFQISAYGAIGAVEAPLEKLVRFGLYAGDFADYDALVAAAIAPGTYGTSLAHGLVRFGAPPAGQISFLVQGDVAGPNGWARLPGQLIRRIALLAGGAGKIDDASLDALDQRRPWKLSIDVTEQTTARELIQRIAASVNATAGVSWAGKLFVAPVELGAPVLALQADGSALPPVASVNQVAVDPPWWRLAIGAERCWTVHALGDIAFTAQLNQRGDYSAVATYREGDIVKTDAGLWLYIATAPSAGHAPPNKDYWASFSADASAALAAAQAAQQAADAANRQLSIIASDGYLSRAEKPQVIQDWVVIDQERAPLVNQSAALGVDSGQLQTAYNALGAYLSSLTPNWSDTTQDTAIDPATFRGKWADYYFAKVSLLNAIAQAAAQTASVTNRVYYSEFQAGSKGWMCAYNPAGVGAGAFGSPVGLLKYHGLSAGGRTGNATASFAADNSQQMSIVSRLANGDPNKYGIKVTPGERIFYGAIVSANNSQLYMVVRFFDAKGASGGVIIGEAPAAVSLANAIWPDNDTTDYAAIYRIGGFALVPANAVWAEIEIYAHALNAGYFDLYVTQVMLCDVPQAQTAWPRYVAGPAADPGSDKTSENTALDTTKLAGQDAAQVAQAVANANSAAAAAQGTANAVQAFTNDVADNNKASPDEKKRYQGQVAQWDFDVNQEVTKAQGLGVYAESNVYLAAWNDFRSFLVNTVQINDLGSRTSFDRNTFRGKSQSFTNAAQALQNALKDRGAQLSQQTTANLFMDPRFLRPGDQSAWTSFDTHIVIEDSGDGRRARYPADNGGDMAAITQRFICGYTDYVDVEFEYFVNGSTRVGNGEGANFGVWTNAYDGSGNLLSNAHYGATTDINSVRRDGWYRFNGRIPLAPYGGNIASVQLYLQVQPITGGNVYLRNPKGYLIRASSVNIGPNGRATTGTFNSSNMVAGIRSLNLTGFTLSQSMAADSKSITVNATQAQYRLDNGATITYPSASFGGLQFSTQYFFWRVDPNLDGGSGYSYSTNIADAVAPGQIYLGFILTANAAGTGGGGGGYGGSQCVDPDMYVKVEGRGPVKAKDVAPGERILCLTEDMKGTEFVEVTANMPYSNLKCRVTAASGEIWEGAINTPIPNPDGSYDLVANAWADKGPVGDADGKVAWSDMAAEAITMGPVQAISCHERVYAAGKEPGRYVFTHNITAKP
ncbi:hypothetical protein [Sphingomonas morindae]|uniref:Tip attachment protein J domain-containing protein n=1 Tax=Sphingomonas morindae TaxID=1541170 RepID=A0ABY4X430_9SPHN|nr:hypothetical protein [Sphingomonas morindae]USI71610.1 hypothetical protein LHA26_09700 [Sphingomonas morindae]